jgi:hypothetical protein
LGVRIRVDVLERRRRGYWGLREVKSSGAVENHHYSDVAVQVHVLRNLGVRLSSVEILHVNTKYKRAKDIIWPKFFQRVDVKGNLADHLDRIEARLRQHRACLRYDAAPDVEPGAHCHTPYSCAYWQSCTASKPSDWVFYLPNLSAGRRAELKGIGIESISAIPDDFPLSPRQTFIRNATRNGTLFVAAELADLLGGFGPPALYLDFEAFASAVPIYPGTRPYQAIPFQWSLHRVNSDWTSEHEEFLADASSDPRRPFAEALISSLNSTKWPIIVYSGYEKTRLKELAAAFPDLAKPIDRIVRQLSDLLPVVRRGVYHPAFEFSSSIKYAAPALCPDVTYKDLDQIADGTAASTTFWLMATGRTDANTSANLRRALLAYCQRDTWAMVRLHQALKQLAANAL